jgi:ABC-type glycerol-3-phosphate transport system substrate-binding protein
VKQELVYWDSNPNTGRTEAFTIAGEAFAGQEGLTFRYIPVGIQGYVDKVIAAWADGKGPDVIDVWPAWVPRLVESGHLLALDPWVADWPAGKHYDPSHRRLSCAIDNTYWFLACDLFIQGTHYRADLIKAAGLPDPRELDLRGEWTLDRFIEYARVLHDPSEKRYGLSLRGGQGGELTALNLMVSANHGCLFSETGHCLLDTPEAINALGKYVSLAHPLKVCQSTAAIDGYREFAWLFYEGKAAMILHNDDACKGIQDRYLGVEGYGNCRLPDDHGDPWLGLAGFGAGARKDSPVADAAARYVLFFVENYGRHLLAGTRASGEGGHAGVSCGPMHPWPAQRDPVIETFRVILETPDRLFDLPWGNPRFAQMIHSTIQPDLSALMRGESSPADCARRWAQSLDSMGGDG